MLPKSIPIIVSRGRLGLSGSNPPWKYKVASLNKNNQKCTLEKRSMSISGKVDSFDPFAVLSIIDFDGEKKFIDIIGSS